MNKKQNRTKKPLFIRRNFNFKLRGGGEGHSASVVAQIWQELSVSSTIGQELSPKVNWFLRAWAGQSSISAVNLGWEGPRLYTISVWKTPWWWPPYPSPPLVKTPSDLGPSRLSAQLCHSTVCRPWAGPMNHLFLKKKDMRQSAHSRPRFLTPSLEKPIYVLFQVQLSVTIPFASHPTAFSQGQPPPSGKFPHAVCCSLITLTVLRLVLQVCVLRHCPHWNVRLWRWRGSFLSSFSWQLVARWFFCIWDSIHSGFTEFSGRYVPCGKEGLERQGWLPTFFFLITMWLLTCSVRGSSFCLWL